MAEQSLSAIIIETQHANESSKPSGESVKQDLQGAISIAAAEKDLTTGIASITASSTGARVRIKFTTCGVFAAVLSVQKRQSAHFIRVLFLGPTRAALSRMRDGLTPTLKPLADLVPGLGFASPFGKDMPVAQHPEFAPRFYIAYQLAFFCVTAFDVHVSLHQIFHGVVFMPR
jgi:hypothetical protein